MQKNILRMVVAAVGLLGTTANAEIINVNGVDLNYVDTGEGTPVVFVHGAISDHRVWSPLQEIVSKTHRYVAYDQRYFGTGNWPDEDAENFSADTHAADLVALIEELGAGPAHVVTWSYSGDVATRAALQRPDLFLSIVHYEPAIASLIEGLPGAAQATRRAFAGFGPAMSAIKEGRTEDSALRFLDAVFDLPEGSAENEPAPWPTIWRDNGRTVPPYLKAPAGKIVTCELVATLRVPTLIVQGAKTFTRYSMMAEQLGLCQPNTVVMTLADVNHDGPYRKPQEFAAMVIDFISLASD